MNLANLQDSGHFFTRCIDAMFRPESERINVLLNPQDPYGARAQEGRYKCIYYNPTEFCTLLGLAREYIRVHTKPCKYPSNEIKFVDVGCGAGQKVFLANMMYVEAYGLEYHKEFVECAQKLLRQYCDGYQDGKYLRRKQRKVASRIFQADATTYIDYNKFDIIYFYRPIHDRIGQKTLEMQVAKYAKVGALALPVFMPEFFLVGNKELESLGWKSVDLSNGYHGWFRESLSNVENLGGA